MDRWYTRVTTFAALATVVLCASSASAQRPSIYISGGQFIHMSDLHTYFPVRFDSAPYLGAGLSLPVTPSVAMRFGVERSTTTLRGDPVYPDWSRGRDHILAADVHAVVSVRVTDRIKPIGGIGIGLRRYVVNSHILTGDIIERRWAEPQVQPAVSALAGLSVTLSPRFALSAEVRLTHARFRAGDDTWGLPRDPVEWQTELRPGLRLDIAL